jgi:hypothetical protein
MKDFLHVAVGGSDCLLRTAAVAITPPMNFQRFTIRWRDVKDDFFLLAMTMTGALIASPAQTEAQIWDLEKAYWEYVKTNDLEKYRALWHDDFVGRPFVSPAPVRKDHITDWITNNTSKGPEAAVVLN